MKGRRSHLVHLHGRHYIETNHGHVVSEGDIPVDADPVATLWELARTMNARITNR